MFLEDRLRAEPIPASVPGSLPVLFFGDLFSAKVATVGINPSRREYLTQTGRELEGESRRFETLGSLGLTNRAQLRDKHIEKSLERMRGYFDPGNPVYAWFSALGRVVEGMGFSFRNRSATHLDLVQEATDPPWSEFKERYPEQASSLLEHDRAFLRKQVEAFPLMAIICTSASVQREISAAFGSRVSAQGRLARIDWTVGTANTRRGLLGIAGWNIPLARATGLDRSAQGALGGLLRKHLAEAGVPLHIC